MYTVLELRCTQKTGYTMGYLYSAGVPAHNAMAYCVMTAFHLLFTHTKEVVQSSYTAGS